MTRVADYIARRLADRGTRHVFLVTGGGAMFLNDALALERRIECICNHHEQASAIAAEGYARVSGDVGVLNVTAGPGGINALNGVFGAWTDSVPMLVLSGQSKRECLVTSYADNPRLRQLGDQEVDIIRMVAGITKYAVQVTDPARIRYHLERALHLALSGRPGPTWLDIPVDVQSAVIDDAALEPYDPAEDAPRADAALLRQHCRQVAKRLQESPRPVVLAGSGVRCAGAVGVFNEVVHRLGLPVATAWCHDIIASDSPVFCGRQGTIGDRAGNFTVQNAESLLIVGSRLCIRQVSYNWKSFARHAYKMHVDVDPAELHKPTCRADLPIVADARVFLEELHRQLDEIQYDPAPHARWLAWCKERLARYPAVLARHRQGPALNPYHFMDQLYGQLQSDDVVVCGDATACIVTFQTAKIQRGQRLFSNSGCASMGYDLPAALGAAAARPGQRVIALAGDGSLQMNVQELQTLVHHGWPVKLFVLSNGGYLSIRSTQENFFGRKIGEGPESGLSFPDVVQLAQAYGLPASRIEGVDCAAAIADVLAGPGPAVCDVVLDRAQAFEPKLSSKRLPDGRLVTAPLEDMFPFLDREELRSNMLVPLEEY